ncbi:hypothetical protein TL16_g11250 [Triparma laevis f. inornata]|uniref:Uncharacterized protein n=2 Tax=Triparma laevis TaxID=1534972 RepID=A0A9W7FG68_9STRA|nr:hypothetical protein TL16_g11250 [Triparma laevis f. inornata]GMI11520.1 hypothetical protein TrLO_g7474 [Triparma laevis f. longispina]
MPHGDLSDYAAFFSSGTGLAMIFAPQLFFSSFGPVEPFFDGSFVAGSEVATALRFTGGTLLFMGMVLYVNRWNTLNGKAGGLGTLIIAVNSALIGWEMDGGFKLRGWHVVSALYLIATAHLMFNANPMWTSATLAAKEKERAAKKAAKNK